MPLTKEIKHVWRNNRNFISIPWILKKTYLLIHLLLFPVFFQIEFFQNDSCTFVLLTRLKSSDISLIMQNPLPQPARGSCTLCRALWHSRRGAASAAPCPSCPRCLRSTSRCGWRGVRCWDQVRIVVGKLQGQNRERALERLDHQNVTSSFKKL